MILIDSKNKLTTHEPMVATIGFFDGVHLGHRFLINQLISEAEKRKLPSAVITFPVHPRHVLNKEYQPALLCGYAEKIERLKSTGIDYCISLDFSIELSKLTAKEFMLEVLTKKYNIDTLLIGYDHRFGHNRAEGFEDYQRYGEEMGMHVLLSKELNPQENISSSRIRKLLENGEVKKAAELLSYNYTISGKIIEGFKVGRTIGFPTANIQIWEDFKVIPAFGVYAVFVHIEGQEYNGMLYIGKRPTLHNGDNVSLEVNIFDFDEDLYNKTLTVEFLEFVRADKKFPGIEELKKQISQDKQDVQKILQNIRKKVKRK